MRARQAIDRGILLHYGILAAASGATIVLGLTNLEATWSGEVIVAGALALVVVLATLPIAASLRRGGSASTAAAAPVQAGADPSVLSRLESSIEEIRVTTVLSDRARQTLFPDREREVLRWMAESRLAARQTDETERLCSLMETLGYQQDALAFRDRMMQARASDMQSQARASATEFDAALGRRDWAAAYREAARIRSFYTDHTVGQELDRLIVAAREQHKQHLENAFREAATRDDVERAMTTLKELDRYMTREEAERLAKDAQAIIARHREALGTTFRLALQDKRWADAARLGQSITEQYPNTKMADEVRAMIDVIRTRATQAAVASQSS